MSNQLDSLVAQAVFMTSLLERALHHDGPWELQVACGETVPAKREFTDRGVTFHATFDLPDSNQSHQARLLCDGEVVDVKTITVGDGGAVALAWTIQVQDSVPV